MNSNLEKALKKLDEKLLDWVTNGVTDTNPITGDEQTRDISDKEAKVILARCKMAGVGVASDDAMTPSGLVNPMQQVMERMKAKGLRLTRGMPTAPPSVDELEREVG